MPKNQTATPILTTRTPYRAQAGIPDIIVPGGQALLLGFGAAALIGAWGLLGEWPGVLIGKLAVLVFAMTFIGTLLWRLDIAKSTLHVIETITGRDMDGDGITGEPPHFLTTNTEEAKAATATHRATAADRARLAELVDFVLRCYTVGTSESAQGIKPGDRAAYAEKRDVLFSLGVADWKDEGQHLAGWRMLTDQAHAIKTVREHVTTI